MHIDYGYRSAILILVIWLIFGTLFVKEASGNYHRGQTTNVLVFQVGDIPPEPKPPVGPSFKELEQGKIAYEKKIKEKQAHVSKGLTKQKQVKSDISYKSGRYQCVVYARQITGDERVKGAARNVPVNSKIPEVGAVVVTKESLPGTNSGHVAVVTDVTQDGFLVLEEANYYRSGKSNVTVGRKLSVDSPLIKGYLIQE